MGAIADRQQPSADGSDDGDVDDVVDDALVNHCYEDGNHIDDVEDHGPEDVDADEEGDCDAEDSVAVENDAKAGTPFCRDGRMDCRQDQTCPHKPGRT